MWKYLSHLINTVWISRNNFKKRVKTAAISTNSFSAAAVDKFVDISMPFVDVNLPKNDRIGIMGGGKYVQTHK